MHPRNPIFNLVNTMKTIDDYTFLYYKDRQITNRKDKIIILDSEMRIVFQIELFYYQLKIYRFGRFIRVDFMNPNIRRPNKDQCMIFRVNRKGIKLLNCVSSLEGSRFGVHRTVESERVFFEDFNAAELRGLGGKFPGNRSALRASRKHYTVSFPESRKHSMVYFRARSVVDLFKQPQERVCRIFLDPDNTGTGSGLTLTFDQVINFGGIGNSHAQNIYFFSFDENGRKGLIVDYMMGKRFSNLGGGMINWRRFDINDNSSSLDNPHERVFRVFEQINSPEKSSNFHYQLKDAKTFFVRKGPTGDGWMLRSGSGYFAKSRVLQFFKWTNQYKTVSRFYYLTENLNLTFVCEDQGQEVSSFCLKVYHDVGLGYFLTLDKTKKVAKFWRKRVN